MYLAVSDLPVKVNQTVAKFPHTDQLLGKLRRQCSGLSHYPESIAIILRHPEAVAGDDVVAKIDTGFDRDDEVVFGACNLIIIRDKLIYFDLGENRQALDALAKLTNDSDQHI